MTTPSWRFQLCLRVLAILAGFFIAVLILINHAIRIVMSHGKVFNKKKRSIPPACMQDPHLGNHGYAHLEDIRLHYVSNGPEDKPLMLLVHGFPEFWYSWRYQLREFKDSYRVVAVDQRGYGDTDKLPNVSDYSLDKLVDDLRQLIITLGYKKCVLVGHDWGGIVAWALAQNHPDMVQQLVILNSPSTPAYLKLLTSGFKQMKKSWYIAFFQMPWVPEMILSASDMDFLKATFTGRASGVKSGSVTEEDVEAYKYTFQRNGLTGPINYYRAVIRYSATTFRMTSADLQVTSPTLIVWGCQDSALDRDLAALSAETVSGQVCVKYIEDCSHWTPMDQHQEVNHYIRQFLHTTAKKAM